MRLPDFPVAIPRIFGHFEPAADRPHRVSGFQHAENFRFVILENLLFGTTSYRSAKHDPFGLAESQRLLGAQGDEVAFNFSNQSEGEAENLAVDGVIESVSFLDSIDVDAFLETTAHYGHDIREVPAEARDFGNNQSIPSFHPGNQASKLAATINLPAAYYLRNPSVYKHSAFLCIACNLILLILRVLLSSTHPDITYNHNFFS